jgi:2-keto-4-pentenoate hydratase/2-oxohepta-3-ene-1,7-dioic acid hydratase in catechol pathway
VATVNGDAITRTWAGAQYFPWSDLVAHAARNTRLRPGDVLGSGTLNRGCLLELGPLEGDRFLRGARRRARARDRARRTTGLARVRFGAARQLFPGPSAAIPAGPKAT